jgi:hypothetical protein
LTVDSLQEFCAGLGHGSREIIIVNIRYQETASEDCRRLTGLEHGSGEIIIVNIRYEVTASEDCKGLRLISEVYKQVVEVSNKFDHQSKTPK